LALVPSHDLLLVKLSIAIFVEGSEHVSELFLFRLGYHLSGHEGVGSHFEGLRSTELLKVAKYFGTSSFVYFLIEGAHPFVFQTLLSTGSFGEVNSK